MYDWANSAFFVTVVSGFFPVFFKQYWGAALSPNESTFWLGVVSALGGLIIALFAPVLGAIADCGGLKKRFIGWFTGLGVLTTAGLFVVQQGDWVMAAVLFMLASIGVTGAIVFYDSMLVDVAEVKDFDRVSATGYAYGYIGSALLFTVNIGMTLRPTWFGLSDATAAVRVSFLMVAVWWALFSIPLFVRVQEARKAPSQGMHAAIVSGWRQFLDTFRHLQGFRRVLLFLAAYFLYIDGIGTVIRMAVDYGLALGFASDVLLGALLLTQFVAFPAALAWGRIAVWIGAKRGILIGIAVFTLACLWAMYMEKATDFFWLAGVIGLVMGGVQSLSRSMYARLIPADKAAEFFGFYNMLGKFAAILGPFLMGLASILTGSARLSLLAVVLLFVAGALLLYFVREDKPPSRAATVNRL